MSHAGRIPNLFVVGAPKSGTSALFHHLGRHPDVYFPGRKEALYFGRDQEFLNQSRPTLDGYLALFAGAESEKVVGEASTTYLYSQTAPHEIREFNPEARVVIMLRSPLEVMHAWHGEIVALGFEPIRDFAKALEAEPRRRAGHDLPNRRGLRHGLYYREIVRYADHVERYFGVFGRDRVRVIVFDDWVQDTRRAYEETLDFLELPPFAPDDLGVVNPSKRIRSARLHDLVAEPPRPLRRVLEAGVPGRVRDAVRYWLLTLNTRTGPRDPIDPELGQRLRVEVAPDIERLARLLGRDLSMWTA